MLRLSLPLTAAALAIAPAAALADRGGVPHHPQKNVYEVGIGVRSLALTPDEIAGRSVYLGGFGIGGRTVLSGPSGEKAQLGNRYATGNLDGGPSVRAIVIGDGHGNDFAIADIEAQGYFAANKDAPTGIEDMRKAVAAAIPSLPADHVVVQSDHTHGGPDFLGVWGGTPLEYRERAFDATVAAIKEAYATRQRGTLWYGVAPARDLLNNQFDYDAANKVMDSDLRVLQARDDDGVPFATLLDFSAHADVLGSHNTLATGDWPQETNRMLEQAFGGKAITVVGTLGRTQPNRPGCRNPSAYPGDSDDLCALKTYSQEVADRAKTAAANATELTGPAKVIAHSYLIEDTASNPILLGLLYGGAAIGSPITRSLAPPFETGNVIGTVTSTARIGDVLLSAGPGEMYPQIPLKVRSVMESLTGGVRGWMTAGLADDQLGYLIAPYESYPEPIKTSFFDSSFLNGDVVGSCTAALSPTCAGDPTPKPIGNDNYFFNVSHTMGERVTCSLLRGAGEAFGLGRKAESAYDRCATFANDEALPEGFDVTASDATKAVPAVPAGLPGS